MQYGVAEFLKGECTLNDTLHKMSGEDLYVVFGGAATSKLEQLLAKKSLGMFMDAARETFDYIILDTPPCALLADAMEIGTLADGILLTVRQNFVSRNQILEGVQFLGDCSTPIIGYVMNMTTRRSGGGYYSGYGYGGYGYGGYGYGKDE